MPDLCHSHVPGGTYFFTVRLQDQRLDLLVRHIDVLRNNTRLCRKRWPFRIDAAVILPNRLHMIWTLPSGDNDAAKRWRMIKTGFSRNIPPLRPTPENHGECSRTVWQRGFWEHLIRDQDDLALHLHLIRSAPIHAGLVNRPGDWPYSSFTCGAPSAARTTDPVPSTPGQEAAVIAN